VNQSYSVSFIVADDLGNKEENGANITDVGNTVGVRLTRMVDTVRCVFNKAKELC